MKNNTLYNSNNDPMTLIELKGFVDKLIAENPDFENASVYSETAGVRQRIVGIVNKGDMFKSRYYGRKEFFLVLMDEDSIEEEIELRSNWTDKQKCDSEEYF